MQEKHLHLSASSKLLCEDNTAYTLSVQLSKDKELSLDLNTLTESKGFIYLKIQGEGKLNFHLNLSKNSQYTYLFINESDAQTEIQEEIYLDEASKLLANYGEFNRGKHKKNTVFHLLGEHASLEVQGAVIVFDELSWSLSALHKAKHTYALLKNYGVISPHAKLTFDVLGHILKGFNGSSAHQITRILNMNEGLRAEVFPKLVIDENDVEASHAASVGQLDPEMIYYLKSRGIPQDKVLALLTMGYLTPILDGIAQSSIQSELLQRIKSCVAYED